MSGSGRTLDYRLRPAKHIERRMMVRALARLRGFHPLESYEYVGFGALHFSDFHAFHGLGIENMTSIESSTKKDRYLANKPFASIVMEHGRSSAVLPRLSWTSPSIVWLDYTEEISAESLGDVEVLADSLSSGSALIVSLAIPQSVDIRALPEHYEDRLGGLAALPSGVRPHSSSISTPAKRGEFMSEILKQKIDHVLRTRSGGMTKSSDQFTFEPVFSFVYSDGMQMYTYGGIVVSADDSGKFAACDFGSLEFVVTNGQPYEIPTPGLTPREMVALDAKLPSPTGVSHPGLTSRQIDQYSKIYRYHPKYANLESF